METLSAKFLLFFFSQKYCIENERLGQGNTFMWRAKNGATANVKEEKVAVVEQKCSAEAKKTRQMPRAFVRL